MRFTATIPSSRMWINDNLKIINKAGSLVPLEANIGQLQLDSVIERQRKSGNPVRIVLLKPRQVGWSTWSEARGFEYIYNTALRTALAVSADTDSTDFIFNMTRIFHEQLPVSRKTKSSNRKEIIYSPPHWSRFLTQTAGKDVLGRGGTTHFLHASECAFWPRAVSGLGALFQMVPNVAETTVILESTANGVGGAFYDLFWQSVDRWKVEKNFAGYIPIFFPWFEFPEYCESPPPEFYKDEKERELAKRFKLNNGQLYWRRIKIRELGGDESFFKQEYPSTALEAFQVAGNPVFSSDDISYQRNLCTKEPRYCVLEGRDNFDVIDVDRHFNCWQIARLPQPGHAYTMGIDTMEARLSDPANIKSSLDRHGVAIFDRVEGRIDAIYHGQGNQSDLGYQCLKMAEFYNKALVAPEIPTGMEVLKIFRDAGYPELYARQVHDEQDTVADSSNLGWRTTMITRRWLVESLKTAMKERSIHLTFSDIVDESETFAYDKTGKPIHRPGKHDDLLFAAMIALQVHIRSDAPRGVYPYEHTGSEAASQDGVLSDLAVVGAIDYGIEEEDD